MKSPLVAWMLAFWVAQVGAGAGEVHSPKANQTSLTIYRPSLESGAGLFDMSNPQAKAGGIALVSETREVDLPAGDSVLVFDNVAQTLVPQSARVESLSGAISEINFDYSLITPGDIIAHSIGQTVTLVRTDDVTGKVTEESAVLESGPDGVLLNINGRFEALDCSGEHEKIIFHSIPPNLSATPRLSAKVRVQKAGKRRLTLSYLATGFDWRAQYVARVDPVENYLSLTGWVTLVNQQTTSFYNAPVDVVAGEVIIDKETKPINPKVSNKSNACWYVRAAEPYIAPMATIVAMKEVKLDFPAYTGSVQAKQHELGDYKLYRLPSPTDVLAQQIKQVKMMEEAKVIFEKIYFVNLGEHVFSEVMSDGSVNSINIGAAVVPKASMRLQNKKAAGLGKPVPAGSLSVIGQNGIEGTQVLIGEDKVRDIPINSSFDITLGDAEHIEIHPGMARNYSERTANGNVEKKDRALAVFNHKPEAIILELRMDPRWQENYQVLKESTPHHFFNGSLVWTLKIPAGAQAELTYTLQRVY